MKFKGGSRHRLRLADDGLWAVFQFVGKAEAQGATSWKTMVRAAANDHAMLPTATADRAGWTLNVNPPLFHQGYFSSLSCVAEVARSRCNFPRASVSTNWRNSWAAACRTSIARATPSSAAPWR